jgi:hypothetical protein
MYSHEAAAPGVPVPPVGLVLQCCQPCRLCSAGVSGPVVIDDVAPDDLRYVGFCLHDMFVEARRRWYQQPGNEQHLAGQRQRWKVRIAGVAALEYRPAEWQRCRLLQQHRGWMLWRRSAAQPEVPAVAAVMEELEQIWARPSAEERAQPTSPAQR